MRTQNLLSPNSDCSHHVAHYIPSPCLSYNWKFVSFVHLPSIPHPHPFFLLLRLFLEQFEIHRDIEGKVRRFRIRRCIRIVS